MPAIEPIRDLGQLRQLAEYWLARGSYRNYALVVLGACTALRTSDLLRLEWKDVYDEARGGFLSHVALRECKTGKPRLIALNDQALHALGLWYPHRVGGFIFANNRKEPAPISRIQAWRIVRAAVVDLGIDGRVSVYSLRKTFGYFAWKSGVLPVMLMDLYNHSSFEVTRRYLGIAQEDRDKVYLGLSLF